MAGSLFLFNSSNEKARQLARQMELRVLLSPIHITAMGLVNVDLNLVPTVIISYFLLYYLHFVKHSLLLLYTDSWYLPNLYNRDGSVQSFRIDVVPISFFAIRF